MRRGAIPPEETGAMALTPEQRYRGARLVASAASDAEDCASLLAALGLEAADGVSGDHRSRADDRGRRSGSKAST
ncbi:MAG TPA: hypothetical protein VGL47_40955 [Amycolatopsis sp.]|uniref:Uncharacterized protein n=1 Tax=Amycolatopsis nalaikhensis TaxID=715472 RepID=A0ABY8XQM3_9PSEU|nr:hypothetical protein [Amycolatopsis sp. 2-2]WIV57805.1 hypothetical protein QP939_03735 [Amycolatopsis sp. 2-2]